MIKRKGHALRLEGDEIGYDGSGGGMTESEIEHVIRTIADPLVRKILVKRMNFVLGGGKPSSARPDAEDLYQTIMLKVAGFLTRLGQRRPESSELRGYLAAIAHNVCNDHLREKYPERNRLRDRVRDFLKRHRDFDRWSGPGGAFCGFRSQRGRDESPLVDGLIRQLAADPESLSVRGRSRGELAGLELPELLAELFRWARGPINSDHLIHIITGIHGIKDRPNESLEERGRVYQWQVTAYDSGGDGPRSLGLFRVIGAGELASIRKVEAETGSSLARAVLYARAGLLDEARRELGGLSAVNKSSLDRVRRSILSVR